MIRRQAFVIQNGVNTSETNLKWVQVYLENKGINLVMCNQHIQFFFATIVILALSYTLFIL